MDNYPEDAPRHPWLDGVFLFPEDHPLAEYERRQYQRWLDGDRAIEPPRGIGETIHELG